MTNNYTRKYTIPNQTIITNGGVILSEHRKTNSVSNNTSKYVHSDDIRKPSILDESSRTGRFKCSLVADVNLTWFSVKCVLSSLFLAFKSFKSLNLQF